MVKGLMRQSVHPMETIKNDYSASQTASPRNSSNDTLPHRIADDTNDPKSPRGKAMDDQVDPHMTPGPGGGGRGREDEYDKGASAGTQDNTDVISGMGSDQQSFNRTGKVARRLTFADEAGGALAEVNYSNRTHYSKQTSQSALPGTGRACCVIS
ncbi:hypothetical protein Poli38472_003722 [Pythium oligandrum]|uniref:Uncharacterized protein n=1 Tax=Pythium oligandrum TaxID=41045 RepID=A0A8K1FNK2_PYTOL|nr:hypothetical protein Poli38472_003722 [Pythium oligandrum]|eukprot:TMW65957.1 hypothetical protein Poli38472_003722 [Pythium oligandrum]